MRCPYASGNGRVVLAQALQRSCESVGITRELDCAGIRQVAPRPPYQGDTWPKQHVEKKPQRNLNRQVGEQDGKEHKAQKLPPERFLLLGRIKKPVDIAFPRLQAP